MLAKLTALQKHKLRAQADRALDAKNPFNPSKQKKALKTSLRNIERLQEIIENILNYSRIESGKYQMLDTEVKVEEIMDESLSRLENLFEGKKVEIKKHYTENGAIVLIDKEALKQICVNLISNAIKFSKENKVSI